MSPLALFLAACAAVYLGTIQAAFAMLMRLALRLMAERDGRSERLGRYLDDPLELFIPVRLLLGLVSVAAFVLIVRLIGVDGLHRVGLDVLACLAFLVVCEQTIPLLIARRDPEAVLDALLPSFDIVARFVRPLAIPLARLVTPRTRVAPLFDSDGNAQPDDEAQSSDEPAPGPLEADERRLLQSIVEFGDTMVREVMTPRPDIAAIEASATLDALRAAIREQGYSRMPVFRGNLDNIQGFVFVKDLILLPPGTPGDSLVTTVMRPAHFVPETKPVSDLLREFQRAQHQMAIVVDEYGGTAGVVTIEDLLEEIVGEIRDEYDRETEPVVEESDGAFLFTGKADVDLLTSRLGVPVEREGFDTVGGFLLARTGRVPSVGEVIEIGDVAFEVIDAERRRVNRVRVRRRPAEADSIVVE